MSANNTGSHRPRKRFGQHFLIDQQVLQHIANSFAAKPMQNLLEIGPGQGALTDVLLQRVEHLTVIELDRDLAAFLSQRYDSSRLTVQQMDILSCNLNDLERDHPDQKLRLIGNLPYNISTPLIFHLLDQIELIEDMLFMLQKEVAIRLAAKPGNKQYGRLTVMTALQVDAVCLFDVPPAAFDPPPKVDSTVIRLTPKLQKIEFDQQKVNQLVTAAFAQRRKTLRNALSKMVSANQFADAGIDPGARAETISPEQFVKLSKICSGD